MLIRIGLAAVLAMGLSSAAFAQKKYQRKTVVDFSELQISGQLVRPEATLVRARGRTKFRPLIRYRGDFRPELLRSIDQVL